MRHLFLILLSVGTLSSCQSLDNCLTTPCDSGGEAPSLPFSLEQMRLALADPIEIKAATEFYPNVPLGLRLVTRPEQNKTLIFTNSCNSQTLVFKGVESLSFNVAEPPTVLACIGKEGQLMMDSDLIIAGIAPRFKRFQIVGDHLIIVDEKQQVLIKAKLVGDEK